MKRDIGDLGLSYEEALHGVQTGVLYEIETDARGGAGGTTPKHLRLGVNSAMVETSVIVALLIEKGVITEEEFREALRLGMNQELMRYEALHPGMKFR